LSNKPKLISKIFSAASNLGQLNHHINRIRELEKSLRLHLPTHMAEDYDWSVGNFRDQHLTLFVTNPGEASKLRFQQQMLLEKARLKFPQIETISIKVVYQGKVPEERVKIGRKLSSEAAAGIAEFAEHVDDQALKIALKRLSQHGQDKKQ